MKLSIRLVAPPALLLFAACGSPGAASSRSSTAGTEPITMNAQDIRFNPATIPATPGEKIALTLSNHDSFKHNFSIHELGVSHDVTPGQTLTFVFTATGSSDLQYFCVYHKSNGMVGTLNLSGNAPSASPSLSGGTRVSPAVSATPYSGY